jgi:hypothetical protein
MSALEELMKTMPPDLEQDAKDFARFLSEKRAHRDEQVQDSAAAVRDYREEYTSTESKQTTLKSDGGHIATLPELVQSLPSEMQQEVQDFIEFLLAKRRKRPRGKSTFEWAGALKDLRHQYTSVELEHKISDWRIQE